MAKPARQRETVHMQAIYRFHPLFAEAGFATYYGGDDASHLPASIEGGDVHMVGNRSVLIGMGSGPPRWRWRSCPGPYSIAGRRTR
jgi:arginine deiminase